MEQTSIKLPYGPFIKIRLRVEVTQIRNERRGREGEKKIRISSVLLDENFYHFS